MAFTPSNEQIDMLTTITNNESKRYTFIAPAGCGKTSTIIYFMNSLADTNRILYLVFNQSMKKEMEKRIKRSMFYYDNLLNEDNIEILTLNGYMRKVLQSKIPEVAFDYKNGSFAETHLQIVMENKTGEKYKINSNSLYVIESFNEYIKPYLLNTISLEDFKEKIDKYPQVNDNILEDLKPILEMKIKESEIKKLSDEEKAKLVKKVYDSFLEDIFYNNVLNQSMPHNIYYKYVYENYRDENLFEGYDYILIDESQDIDRIMVALLENTTRDIKIAKFGDNFQHINAFRGTINSLEDENSVTKYLTMSYRLSPYHALLATAYLHNQGKKLGLDEKKIPQIYGYERKNMPALNDQLPKEQSFDVFSDKVINAINSIKIEENPIYIDLYTKKIKIEDSIKKKSKKSFENAIKKFLKNRDYEEFLNAVLQNTNYLKEKESKDYFDMLREENKQGKLHRELYDIAKSYNYNFSKKEKAELLQNDSYAFLARNNDKVIDLAYNFIKKIPNENNSDFPLFNIKLNTALSEKFDDISKNRFSSSITLKEMGMFFDGLKNLKIINNTLPIKDLLDKFEKFKISENILNNIAQDIDRTIEILFNAKIISQKYSLKDIGIKKENMLAIAKNAITQTKKKTKKEIVEGKDIKESGFLKNWKEFLRIDDILLNNFSIQEIEENANSFVSQFYKYSKIKEIVNNNQNITMASDKGVYNICFSTVHQAKGLEFQNVFIANDVYNREETVEMEKEDKLTEFYLAYVAMTRTKGGLFFETGSDFYQQLKETIEEGFERMYQTSNDNIVIIEKLKKNPILIAEKIDKEYVNVRDYLIEFSESIKYPNYKNIKIRQNENGFEMVAGNDEVSKLDLNKEKIINVFPVENEKMVDFMNNWREIRENIKKEERQLMAEANMVF